MTPYSVAAEIKQTMTDDCGIFRTGETLERALATINRLQEQFANARITDVSRRYNTDLLAALETEHLLTFSRVIVSGALARTESRGAHFRTDYAKRDDENWLKHTLAHKPDEGIEPKLSYKPVTIFWDRYPPQERKY